MMVLNIFGFIIFVSVFLILLFIVLAIYAACVVASKSDMEAMYKEGIYNEFCKNNKDKQC